MKQLSKQEILAAEDKQTESVFVPEWGGHVTVAVMSSKARDKYEAGKWQQVGKDIKPNFTDQTAKLLALTIVNQDGSLMFTQQEIQKLADKSSIATERVAKVALKLNSLTEEAVEDSIKNSAPDLNAV